MTGFFHYLHVALGQSGVEVGVHVLGYDREVDGAVHPQPAVRALLPVVRLLVSHPLRQEGVEQDALRQV